MIGWILTHLMDLLLLINVLLLRYRDTVLVDNDPPLVANFRFNFIEPSFLLTESVLYSPCLILSNQRL